MPRQKTSLTIAKDIEKSFRKNRQLLLDSMAKLDPGSAAYLNRLVALSKLEQAYRQERADRGLDPVNLGAATRTVFMFTATAERQPDTRDAKRKAFEAELDAAYGYTYDDDDEGAPPAAPAVPVTPRPQPRRRSKQ